MMDRNDGNNSNNNNSNLLINYYNKIDSRLNHVSLFHMLRRRIAQCIGRGMFTIWSFAPTITKPIDIPNINLQGIISSKNYLININFKKVQKLTPQERAALQQTNDNDEKDEIIPNLSIFDEKIFEEYEDIDDELYTRWARFHNGCSAGLRVFPDSMFYTNNNSTANDTNNSNSNQSGAFRSEEAKRTWILYNRPKHASFAHSGFILAMGLNCHLKALKAADFYWYLTRKDE